MSNRVLTYAAASLALLLAAGCAAPPPTAETVAARTETPRAEQRPHTVRSPHGDRVDEYYWLRDDRRKDPAMLAYLEAENAYASAWLEPLAASSALLFDEMMGRIKQDDSSVPAFEDGYWYYQRFEDGKEYPLHARKAGTLDAPEEILLDGNKEAEGSTFFKLGAIEISPDGTLMAWTEDRVGRNLFSVRFQRLRDGARSPLSIPNVQPGIAWSAAGLIYIERDPQTLLGYKVRVHAPGTPVTSDRLVYEETDRSFYLDVKRSRSDRFVFIDADSTEATETRVARADDASLSFSVPIPRQRDHLYAIEDHGDRWIVRTNREAPNFRLVSVPMDRVGVSAAWQDLIAHRDDAFIEDFLVFREFVAVQRRSGALSGVSVKRWVGGAETAVAPDDAAYIMAIDDNPEVDSGTLRYQYESYITPPSIYDLDVASGKRKLMKRQPVLGGYDPSRYDTALLWAPARDGERIPVTLAYRRGTPRDGSAALVLQGYGSYGSSSDPDFRATAISLLDRGVVVATAHVRGGQELGRRWYDQGRLLNKKNTFTDFIDAADYLVAQGWTRRGRVVAVGGSAGGLLMGAVTNMAPDRWGAVLSYVPFVDVVTTMLDETIPLTTNEFDEWGNPKQQPYYDYMLSYSPYDQITAQAYPPMLVRTGLWDSQVQYFEPAKYVARLRARRSNDAPLLFLTQMSAGHGGRSGRFERIKDQATDYAFALTQIGIAIEALPAAEPAQRAVGGGR
jgi:oligopeptidase B